MSAVGRGLPEDRIAGGFAWRQAGEGPPVVFLHGLGGTRLAWEPQLEGLSPRFRCLAWDMPGYGDSVPLPELTFPALADAVAAFLDVAEVARADVVGLSFGAQQALHFALAHPSRIGRLVLADTSHRFGADGTDPEQWKRARLAPLDAGSSPAQMAGDVVDAITAPGFSGRERDRTLQAFAGISSDAFRAAVGCLPSHDVSNRLGEIVSPTLVIVGERDEETPVDFARAIAAGIGDARIAVIPGAGHLTPAEAPEQFNQLVEEFLSGTPGTSRAPIR